MAHPLRHKLAQEAARIVCEEQLTDYRLAKHKAAQRLGLGRDTALPDNVQIHDAVLEYLRIFGGEAYADLLQRLRQTAVKAMRYLSEFEPRLVGAVVSGAVTGAHRVQLHAFSDKAETLEITLINKGLECEQDDRRYRFPDGSEREIPVTSFDLDGIGVDVAIFDQDTLHERPINPLDGQSFKRLDLKEAGDLLNRLP